MEKDAKKWNDTEKQIIKVFGMKERKIGRRKNDRSMAENGEKKILLLQRNSVEQISI